jgi:hypothetical protein
MGQTREYVTHDFSAVNAHVDELTRRARVVTSSRRAEVFGKYAVYGSGLAISLGIMGWLLFLGISKLTNPQPEVIEKEVVVEKPVSFKPNIYINTPNPENVEVDKARDGARQRISEIPANEGLESSSKSVFNFVIFNQIPFSQDEFEEVIVGMRYEDSKVETPTQQWCYIERQRPNRTSQKATLAVWKQGVRENVNLSADMATSLSTNTEVLKTAQNLCVFR